MSERISWLDGWRGLACWLMLVYHLLFDLLLFGWVGWSFILSWPVVLLEKFIAYSFILCAGISARLTRSNLRRGLVTGAVGLVVVAASYIVDAPIKFGILQFLSAAMLLYALAGRFAAYVPEKIAPFLWLGLFIGTYIWTSMTETQAHWLFWLGFKYAGFVSYDYFPLLPYIFLFLLGTWMGQMLQQYRSQMPFLAKKAPAWLTWPGRRTLWIYVIHQPVLYGLCFAVSLLQGA